MSDDIVVMLRLPTGCEPPSEWETKAADEIERLRRRVAALERVIADDMDPDECSDELNQMMVLQIHEKYAS